MLLLLLALACTLEPVVFDAPTDYAGPLLVVDEAPLLMGSTTGDEPVSATLWVANGGDLPLGIGSVELASSSDPDQGHAGSFSWSWDPGDPTAGLSGVDDLSLVLLPGDSASLTIYFHPQLTGTNADALILTTAGGGDAEELVDQAHADSRVGRALVWLEGQGEGPTSGVPVLPDRVDLGFAWPDHEAATAWVDLANAGTGPMYVDEVRLGQCAPGFEITDEPEPGTQVLPDDRTLIGVAYTAPHEGKVYCDLEAEVDGEVVSARLQANTTAGCPGEPPLVQIHSPTQATPVQPGAPLRLWLEAEDPDQPADTLTCRVSSALLLHRELWSCELADTGVAVDLPTEDWRLSGVDVLLVEVVDACGQRAQASLPVLVDTPWPSEDEDGDGFGADDCDDADPGVHPAAAEHPDGVDEDCDGLVDEGTSAADDDGDGLSEDQGDCDDSRASAYPGAPEEANGRDDDCDGLVDEDTEWADDDGDGWSEVGGDCDDSDESVHPGAAERCANGRDEDCDLEVDEPGCILESQVPMLVGGIQFSQTVVEAGDTVEARVRVVDDDGDGQEVSWECTGGQVESVGPAAAVWTVPDEPDSVHKLVARVADSQRNSDLLYGPVEVVHQGSLERGQAPLPPSCAHGTAPAAFVWLLLPWLLGRRRAG